jgi:hypothetical protein
VEEAALEAPAARPALGSYERIIQKDVEMINSVAK